MEETHPPYKLELQGDLSVARAASVLEQIQVAFRHGTDIQIQFGEVAAADLSSIQLLISASWTARDQGIHLSISGELPEPIERIARESATEHMINEMLLS